MTRIWRGPAPSVALAYATGPVVAGQYVSVPDGRCGLTWVDGHVWWLGPSARPWRAEGDVDVVVGIRFDHAAGYVFAGGSLRAWRDSRVELTYLPSRSDDVGSLVARLGQAGSLDRQADVLVSYAWATARGGVGDPAGAELLAAATSGEAVGCTAARLGLSTRQLHRRYLDMFGMPPTALRRILRLHAAATGATMDGIALAQVAFQAGYTDQAHLTRETRALTLATPSRALPGRRRASDPFKTDRVPTP